MPELHDEIVQRQQGETIEQPLKRLMMSADRDEDQRTLPS